MKNQIKKNKVFCFLISCGFASASVQAQFLLPNVDPLPNGMRTVWFSDDSRPSLDISLILKTSHTITSKKTAERANLLARLLGKGSLGSSGNEISLRLVRLGASFSIHEQDQDLNIQVHGLGRDSDALLDILAEMVLHPSFQEAELSTEKDRLIENLTLRLDQPDAWLFRAYRSLMDTEREKGLSKDELHSLSLNDVREFYQNEISPAESTLILLGKVNPKTTRAKIASLFGNWKASPHLTKKTVPVPEKRVFKNLNSEILLVNAPSLYPVQIKIGFRLPKLDQAESKALILANTILGGSFHSKLNRYSRDQLGLSYALNSILHFNREGGDLSVLSSTRSENSVPLIKSILFVMNQMREGGVDLDDLLLAQDYLCGSFTVMMSYPSAVTARWLEGDLFQLGETYLAQFIPEVRQVTLEQVRATILKNFKPEDTAIVVVGDGSVLNKELSTLRKVRIVLPENLP